ncbi:MAG: hypothetical protein ACTSPD_07700 [Promethearchaeota archaeon]
MEVSNRNRKENAFQEIIAIGIIGVGKKSKPPILIHVLIVAFAIFSPGPKAYCQNPPIL